MTQATVSRDLGELGASKMRVSGTLAYRLPDDAGARGVSNRTLARALKEFSLTAVPAHSLVVVSTAPGHAPAVGRTIDMSGEKEVIGSVAGDDTILVATPDPKAAKKLAAAWAKVIEGRG